MRSGAGLISSASLARGFTYKTQPAFDEKLQDPRIMQLGLKSDF